jgi:hypothetical protein
MARGNQHVPQPQRFAQGLLPSARCGGFRKLTTESATDVASSVPVVEPATGVSDYCNQQAYDGISDLLLPRTSIGLSQKSL